MHGLWVRVFALTIHGITLAGALNHRSDAKRRLRKSSRSSSQQVPGGVDAPGMELENMQRAATGTAMGYVERATVAGWKCRDELHKNGECCLDDREDRQPTGVKNKWLRRKNSRWNCTWKDGEGCYDDLGGERGDDLLWWPEGATCSTQRILYVHGGSWYFGSPNTTGYGTFCAKIAKATKSVVLAIDYPLAPVYTWEHMGQYTLNALQYLATHGPDDCENNASHAPPLFIMGDSSGGGLAYSVLLANTANGNHLLLRETGSSPVKLAGAIFISPWLNLKCNTPTYVTNIYSSVTLTGAAIPRVLLPQHLQDAPRDKIAASNTTLEWHNGDVLFNTRKGSYIKDCVENAMDYVGAQEYFEHPLAAPLWARSAFLSALPPTLFVVGGSEVLLGDSIMAAQKAAAAGAEVVLDIYEGMWHNFCMYTDGCGSGYELWEATLSLKRMGSFVEEVANTGHPPCGFSALGVPRTVWHMTEPDAQRDWDPSSHDVDYFVCPPASESIAEKPQVPAAPPGNNHEPPVNLPWHWP